MDATILTSRWSSCMSVVTCAVFRDRDGISCHFAAQVWSCSGDGCYRVCALEVHLVGCSCNGSKLHRGGVPVADLVPLEGHSFLGEGGLGQVLAVVSSW